MCILKEKKKDISDENLCNERNQQSIKVMVSAGLTWHGVTRPIFVGKQGLKVNAVNYKKHLKKQLFPAINRIYPRNDWIFLQDGASSHTSNLMQDFLNESIPRRFIRKENSFKNKGGFCDISNQSHSLKDIFKKNLGTSLK